MSLPPRMEGATANSRAFTTRVALRLVRMVPDVAWRVARQVSRHLGLGEVVALEAATGGLLNRALVATTPSGRWFMKGSRYPSADPVVREHDVAAVARRGGIPSPAPVPARDGRTATWAGKRWWAAFPFVDGFHLARASVGPNAAAILGETLGRIHAVLADTPAELVRRLPAKGAPSPAETLARIRAFTAEIARFPAPTAFDGHAQASLAYRQSVVEGEVGKPWPGEGLPSGTIHGDFHVGNVRFAPGDGLSVAAVVDWELAATAPRALEVARALDLAIDLPADLASGATRVRAFAGAYGQHATLGREAADRLPDLYRSARAHSLWVYEEHYRHGEAPTDAVAIDDLATLQWWHREHEAIRATIIEAFRDVPTPRVIASPRA